MRPRRLLRPDADTCGLDAGCGRTPDPHPGYAQGMSAAFWVCALVTLVSAAVSFGFAVDGLRRASAESRTASSYAFSRSLALLVVAVVALFTGSVAFVAAVAAVMVLVQAFDVVVGWMQRDPRKTFGPAGIALANLAVLIWLLVQ